MNEEDGWNGEDVKKQSLGIDTDVSTKGCGFNLLRTALIAL